jgi:DNA replication and repair protein RecF
LRIARVQAVGWRNLVPLDLRFDPEISLNVLYGQNAQGKTNLLEALYFLGTFRSFRTGQAFDLVQRDAAEARISVELQTRDLVRTVEARLVRGVSPGAAAGAVSAAMTVSRAVEVDGKLVRRTSAAFGLVSVVLFVPDDLALARAAPAARRRFVDMAIAGLSSQYLDESTAFQRILRSRNALLRGAPGASGAAAASTWLDTLDEQLAHAGARVVERRRRFVADMGPRVQAYFRALHADLPVALVYACDESVAGAASEREIEAALLAGLVRRRVIDTRRRHTTFGPQTDDLELRLGGRPAREHASQGQLRSLMLALKLSELALLEAERGESPILLLDDVPSELDPERRHFLFETLSALGCQTVLSVADRGVVPLVSRRADFHVRGGVVAGVGAGR